MTLTLYGHPFSSYCQKVLVALYENDTAFSFRMLGPDAAEAAAEWAALWPIRRFPVLADAGRTVAEASIIVEHLDLHHPGPVRLLPADPAAALDVRFMDRFFDNYVMTPMQKIVTDRLRAPEARDRQGTDDARTLLDRAYGWLDGTIAARMGGRPRLQPGGLRGRARAPLCRLGTPHRAGVPRPARLPGAPAAAPLLRPCGRRGTALPAALSARRARSRLNARIDPGVRDRPLGPIQERPSPRVVERQSGEGEQSHDGSGSG